MGNSVFVHAADLHLGNPLGTVGGPEKTKELAHIVSKAFDNLIQKTIDLKAEFLVLAGDIYDDGDRDPATQLRFVEGLERLAENNIKTYICHGNHDPLNNEFVTVARMPSSVIVFQPGEVQQYRHDLSDGGHVTVAGISYARRDEPENLAKKFLSINRKDERAIVGVLHTNVGGTAGHHNYAPCKSSDLEESPVDYWALGHVHKRRIEAMGTNRFWAYPGNIQGRDAGEPGAHGALVVPITKHGIEMPQFEALDVARFEEFYIDCTTLNYINDLAPAINNAVGAPTLEMPKIIRLNLFGRTPIRKQIKEMGIKELMEFLQPALSETLCGGFIDEIVDTSLPMHDIKQLQKKDDLLSDLLNFFESVPDDQLLNELDPSREFKLTSAEAQTQRSLLIAELLDAFASNEDDS